MQTHAMVIKADAKAMGAVTALDTRVSNRWQPSDASKRVFDGKPFSGTSECISYMPDGTVKVFTRTRKNNRVPSRYQLQNRPQRITAADLAPIGDTNH